jgi:hypothetical protein
MEEVTNDQSIEQIIQGEVMVGEFFVLFGGGSVQLILELNKFILNFRESPVSTVKDFLRKHAEPAGTSGKSIQVELGCGDGVDVFSPFSHTVFQDVGVEVLARV